MGGSRVQLLHSLVMKLSISQLDLSLRLPGELKRPRGVASSEITVRF